MYNGAAYLREALDSVLSQTVRDLELVVIDDGSTDDTRLILEAAARRDARVRVCSNGHNLGLIPTLNRGLSMVRGTWVARMDADDVCTRERLAVQLAWMEQHPEVSICGGWIYLFGDVNGRTWRTSEHDAAIRSELLFMNPIAHPTVIFRREPFEAAGLRYPEDSKHAEDYALWVEAAPRLRFGNVQEVVLLHRHHGGQVRQQASTAQREMSNKLRRHLLAQLGLEVTGREADLHEWICDRPAAADHRQVVEAEDWLRRLVEANRRVRLYEERALARTVGAYWREVCKAGASDGLWAVPRFLRSPLSDRSSWRPARWGGLAVRTLLPPSARELLRPLVTPTSSPRRPRSSTLDTPPMIVAYILSHAFSGSTLLTMMLASHRRIATLGELVGVNHKILEDRSRAAAYPCSCGKPVLRCPHWLELGRRLRERGVAFEHPRLGTRLECAPHPRLRQWADGPLRLAQLEPMRDRFVASAVRHGYRRAERTNLAVIEEVLALERATVFIDASKDPIRLERLARVSGLDLRGLYLTRDGRAVAHSVRNRGLRTFEDAVGDWVRLHRVARRCLHRSGRPWMQVRYEDLCREPTGTVGSIHRFLDIAVEPWPPDEPFGRGHILGNDMRLHFDGAIRLDERWRRELTPREFRWFDRHAGALNRELGQDAGISARGR